ncbi:hypothetical protein ALC56_06302, partial [Trachymyrmex septentrionalis]
LTKYLPDRVDTAYKWKQVAGFELADRDSMSSDPIDIIGADLFGIFVLDGVRKSSQHELIAQNTTFDWILSGTIASFPTSKSISALTHHGVIIETLNHDLRRFWEIEEVSQEASRSPEEHQCEEHFKATHSRTPEGRLSFDYRLKTDHLRKYREFIADYETLGHMIKSLPTEVVKPEQNYYIPHLAVLRDSSATTHLRVVFIVSYTLRVLEQLVDDEGAAFPLAVPVLRHQTYVDDCAFAADSLYILDCWFNNHQRLSCLKAISIPNHKCYCWTDSTITLAWLRQSPSRWKIFVSNHVSNHSSLKFLDVIPTHVCASRGLAPDLFKTHALWWSGPRPESPMCVLHATPQWDLASRYSSWPKLLRITAYLYRFLSRLRLSKHSNIASLFPEEIQAFVHTGVDYAGSIAVRTSRGRRHKLQKAYIALFVCLTTKALHLELVSDYTPLTFIAAYQRFVSRRGLPTSMYSDNAALAREPSLEGDTSHPSQNSIFSLCSRTNLFRMTEL